MCLLKLLVMLIVVRITLTDEISKSYPEKVLTSTSTTTTRTTTTITRTTTTKIKHLYLQVKLKLIICIIRQKECVYVL